MCPGQELLRGMHEYGVSDRWSSLRLMLKEIGPWLVGPAGIVIGWWLNQHTLRGNAEREAQRADDTEAQQRVLDTVRLGRDTAALIRSLLHGIYLKSQHGTAPKGLGEMMDEFNRSKDAFRGSVLSLRVLGPSWAVEGAETLDVEITRLTELAFIMQKAVKVEHMTSVNARLPQLDYMVNEYVTTVSGTYNAAPSELPPHPDMETEGRWKPLDE